MPKNFSYYFSTLTHFHVAIRFTKMELGVKEYNTYNSHYAKY